MLKKMTMTIMMIEKEYFEACTMCENKNTWLKEIYSLMCDFQFSGCLQHFVDSVIPGRVIQKMRKILQVFC